MKNNKGFVFIETIVVIVVLTIGLITIYLSFSTLLANEKRRNTYNNINYIYRTYYFEDYLASLNMDRFLKDQKSDGNNNGLIDFSCDNNSLFFENNIFRRNDSEDTSTDVYKNKISFCKSFMKNLNIKRAVIIYELDNVKKCITNKGEISINCNFLKNKFDGDPNLLKYFKTLKRSNKEKQTGENIYRLVIEFEEKRKKYDDVEVVLPNSNNKCWDNTMPFKDENNNSACCPNGYSSEGSKCYIETIKNHYNNIDLVVNQSIENPIEGEDLNDDEEILNKTFLVDALKTKGLQVDVTSDSNLRYIDNANNNYIYFNNELWRIIGLFNNVEKSNNDKTSLVKIIRNESLGEYSWQDSGNNNKWAEAKLQEELNTDYLGDINSLRWYSGDDLVPKPTSIIGKDENLIENVKWNIGLIDISHSANRIYNAEKNEKWTGKVGLINVSDYALSINKDSKYNNRVCQEYQISKNCYEEKTWLTSMYGYTINKTSDSSSVAEFHDVYSTWGLNSLDVHYSRDIRPVVYLKENVLLTEGDGTSNNPYKIKLDN